jgi:hypothetical protein
MIKDQSETQSYLIPSAWGQKPWAKLGGSALGECSQGGAAMPRREEACPRYLAGWRFGLGSERVCNPVTKLVAPAPWELPLMAHAVCHGAAVWVVHVIMQGKWHCRPTGEVPTGPAMGPVTRRYKVLPKRGAHAWVAGTGSPRPGLWGCQQSQSRLPRFATGQATALKGSTAESAACLSGAWDQLARATTATKWPGGTFFRQPVHPLSNSPQQPACRGRTVCYR